MNITMILVLLGLIAIASLITVSFMAKKQREALFRYQKAIQQKRAADHFEDLAQSLAAMTDTPRVPTLLQKIAVATLERVLKDAPDLPNIEASTQKARQHLATLEQGNTGIPMVCLTATELAKAQKQVAEALRVLRAETRSGEISNADMESLTEELQWSWLQLEVRSHQKLASLAEDRNDRFSAFSHYKQAQHKLMQSNLREQQRMAQIRELAAILSGNSDTSGDIPPEKQSA